MNEKTISSWEEFEREIGLVLSQHSAKRRSLGGSVSVPLFRGQANAEWTLKTTLERYTGRPFGVKEYWELIRNYVQCPVESMTERQWDIGSYPPEENSIPMLPPPGYEFMVYLRHHGFPSPLLDWSESPYVAAYFAFRQSGLGESERGQNVAVYCFQEYCGGGKTWTEGEAHIDGLGPNLVTTRRHFHQQSWYTVSRVQETGGQSYTSHEIVFQKDDPDQDALTKFRIPVGQYRPFLDRLSLININAYTLFGSEEGLMETLAYKAIVAKSL